MLLTIAIPSHNDSSLLKKAIESIKEEEGFGEFFNILVADNSLDNENKNLYITEYKSNPNIQYYRTKEFKCIDSNVNRSVELSKGEFVWIFGDDDLLVKGIMRDLLSFLRKNKPDLLVLNSQSFCEDNIIEDSRLPYHVKSFYLENENDLFLTDTISYLTYVCSILVRKSLWVANFNRTKIGSAFAHIDCVASIKNNRKVFLFKKPAIKMRLGNQTWKQKTFSIWYVKFPMIIWDLNNYSINSKEFVTLKNPINSLKIMVAARSYGRLNLNNFNKYIRFSRNVNFVKKILIFLISTIPVKFFSQIYRIYIILFKNKHTSKFSPSLALSKLKGGSGLF